MTLTQLIVRETKLNCLVIEQQISKSVIFFHFIGFYFSPLSIIKRPRTVSYIVG